MGEGGEDCTEKRKNSQGGMSLVIRKKERKKESKKEGFVSFCRSTKCQST